MNADHRRLLWYVAVLFANDDGLVGFDGSQLEGRAEIESVLSQIFAHHQTAAVPSMRPFFATLATSIILVPIL